MGNTMMHDKLADDLLHGLKAIADEIGVTPRRAHYLCSNKMIPARQIGSIWVGSKSELRRHFRGEAA
jgi:hypothetical protein